MKRSLPWVVVTIFVVYVAVAIFRPSQSTGGFDTRGFGRLPIWLGGRVQPIDSAGRLALLQIRGTASVPQTDRRWWHVWERAPELGATEWLLEVLAKPDAADARQIFRIDNAAVRVGALPAPPESPVQSYYSFKDLHPRVKEIGEQVARASKVKSADLTAADRGWLKLRNALFCMNGLKNTLQPNSFLQQETAGRAIDYDFGARFRTPRGGSRAAPPPCGQVRRKASTEEAGPVRFVQPCAGSRAALLSIVPPTEPERGRDRWTNTGAALVGSSRTGTFPAPLSFFAHMSAAYARGDTEAFNGQLASYEKWLEARGLTPEVRRAGTESFYNDFQPLVRAFAVYVVVLAFAIVAIISRSTTLYRTSAMLVVVAAALHATGILFDMMLQGTLPITNVYSGIVCAGLVAVLAGAAPRRKWLEWYRLLQRRSSDQPLIGAHGVAPGGLSALFAEALDIAFWLAAVVTLLALCMASTRGRVRAVMRSPA